MLRIDVTIRSSITTKTSEKLLMSNQKPLLDQVMLAFQVIPRVKEGNNFEVVDKAIEVVKASGVPFQVSEMETTLKGELNQLLEIVKAAQQACYDAGAVEVITNIKIHSKTEAATDTFCTYDRGVTKANHMFVNN
ncbi:thiamine-binding protein [Aeromonas allosaccharophila]|uniref:thiamine-binding protein n=1 Tax=Aeromonas allosaccharophila TaxID=656 RepID=UPI001955DDE6|nr:thiamine-binding protein [Aeromonas allosaccharophila]